MKCGVPPSCCAARRTNSLIWKCACCCCMPPVAGTVSTPGIGGSPVSTTARTARPQPIASTDPGLEAGLLQHLADRTGQRADARRRPARRRRRRLFSPSLSLQFSRQFIRLDEIADLDANDALGAGPLQQARDRSPSKVPSRLAISTWLISAS